MGVRRKSKQVGHILAPRGLRTGGACVCSELGGRGEGRVNHVKMNNLVSVASKYLASTFANCCEVYVAGRQLELVAEFPTVPTACLHSDTRCQTQRRRRRRRGQLGIIALRGLHCATISIVADELSN